LDAVKELARMYLGVLAAVCRAPENTTSRHLAALT